MEDKKHLDRGHVYMLRELSSGLVALEGLYNDLFN